MKKILLALLLATTLHSNPYDQPDNSFFNQKDKQMHIGFSFFIGMAGNAICKQEFGLTPIQSWWCGLGSALIVGGIKEVFVDTNGDWGDMGANAIGGAVGSGGMYVIYEFQ